MKTKNNLLAVLLLLSYGLFAQGKRMMEKKEEIFALKVAFITNKLPLIGILKISFAIIKPTVKSTKPNNQNGNNLPIINWWSISRMIYQPFVYFL